MQFSDTIKSATFLKRYKRFFADVKIGSKLTVAHVPNTGSLKGCLSADAPCLVTENNDPARKLKATLQFVKTPSTWVGVNTSLPNELVYELWVEKRVPHWQKYAFAKREHKFSKETRFDLALAVSEAEFKAGKIHYVEVKNVTLAENGIAMFPDAETTRGQKHLRELCEIVEGGGSAEMVFVVQRTDCHSFRPADTIDPEYGRLLRACVAAGVLVNVYACRIDVDRASGASIVIEPKPLPVILD